MTLGPLTVVGSLASGVGTLALIGYLREYRGKPGASWLLGALTFQAIWSFAYGVGLLVFDPTLRWVLEVAVWTAMGGEIVFFVAFAFDYTGRGGDLDDRWLAFWFGTPLLVGVVTLTNPIHQLVWTGFRVVEVDGVVAAVYTLQPWALAGATVGVLLASFGSLLLFETVLSYGPLYRREAIAVGLSTIPPAAALLAWLYGIGPVSELNFTTVAFLPHVALDAYAFLGSDMFEFHPATRRAGERAAIEDLGTPVIIVDEQNRIVTVNAAAESVLGAETATIRTRELSDLIEGDTIDPTVDDGSVTITTHGRTRIYAVTTTPLLDGRDTHLGYTITLGDITEDRRREQRLSVLNRVLRHNLRNDMSVVRGFADTAKSSVDDDSVADMLDTVLTKADDLVALGEKAREIDTVLDGERQPECIEIGALLDAVLADVDGTTDVDVTVEPTEVTVERDRDTLEVVLKSVVENAIEYAASTIRIRVEDGIDTVEIRIEDDGPGIPDTELDALDAGEETDLQHASGLGLWLATWGTRRLGGEINFDVTADGTTVTVSLPR